MRKFIYFICLLFTFVPSIVMANSGNFLGPIIYVPINKVLNPSSASSVSIEGGPRNYRASGTIGWEINSCEHFKLSAEYLKQRITYNFLTTETQQWVEQEAIGAGYQYSTSDCFQNYFELTGFFSRAPCKNLTSVDNVLIPTDISFISVSNSRRIAGSHGFGIAPSFIFHPWDSVAAKIGLNWDDVKYDRTFYTEKIAQGIGATLGLKHQLPCFYGHQFQWGGFAEFRSPFDHYHLEINWIKPWTLEPLTIGIFGSYINGKKHLPSTSIAGFQINYWMDKPRNQKMNSLLAWTSKSVAKVPQVLAIAEEPFS